MNMKGYNKTMGRYDNATWTIGILLMVLMILGIWKGWELLVMLVLNAYSGC